MMKFDKFIIAQPEQAAGKIEAPVPVRRKKERWVLSDGRENIANIFHFHTPGELRGEMKRLGAELPLSKNTGVLRAPVCAGGKTIPNSLAVHPMEGCDANADGTPGTLTFRRYGRYAAGGAGLIWLEAVAVEQTGRASPRQLVLNDRTAGEFARLREHIDKTAAAAGLPDPMCIVQLTHSGRFSRPQGKPAPVIAYHDPTYLSRVHIDDADLAPVTDDALERLEEKLERAAMLAKKAGFDGADIKCCHRYLASELLSAYERPGRFGGSFEGRTRFLRETAARSRDAAGGDFLITTRLNLYDGFQLPRTWGAGGSAAEVSLDEPMKLVGALREDGMRLVSLTMGCPYVNPHVNRPSDRYGRAAPEHPLLGVARMTKGIAAVQKAYPGLAIVGAGYSWLRQYAPLLAAGLKENGGLTLAGFGRGSFAYPDFARDLLETGGFQKEKCCVTCGKCTELMRAGSETGCVIRDREIYLAKYRKACGKEGK